MDEFLLEFFNYIFVDTCNCIEKECKITDIDINAPEFYNTFIKSDIKEQNCNMIKNTNQSKWKKYNKIQIIDLILEKFIEYNLITLDGSKYFLLNSHKRLTWRNIKHLDKNLINKYIKTNKDNYKKICEFFGGENTIYINYLFWYFRKAIVDSITSDIIKKTKVIGLSVGSTKIDSDYDITLYGSYKNIFITINKFNKYIESTFNNSSEVIFDTNLYGASFITSNFEDISLNDYTCGNTNFSITENGKVSHFYITQHIWAFIKVLTKLETLRDEIIYDYLIDLLFSSSDKVKTLLTIAEEFINKVEPMPDLYDKIVSLLENKKIKDGWETNYISFVNYNGSETYFTRGAFIDVVVNSQMCRSEYIKLSTAEYLDSFVENISELFTHFTKDKYINRAKTSLLKINTNNSDNISILLNNISDIQIKCKIPDSVLSCSKFLLLFDCVEIIKKISDSYFENIDLTTINDGIILFKDLISDLPNKNSLHNLKTTFSKDSLYTLYHTDNISNDSFIPRSSMVYT